MDGNGILLLVFSRFRSYHAGIMIHIRATLDGGRLKAAAVIAMTLLSAALFADIGIYAGPYFPSVPSVSGGVAVRTSTGDVSGGVVPNALSAEAGLEVGHTFFSSACSYGLGLDYKALHEAILPFYDDVYETKPDSRIIGYTYARLGDPSEASFSTRFGLTDSLWPYMGVYGEYRRFVFGLDFGLVDVVKNDPEETSCLYSFNMLSGYSISYRLSLGSAMDEKPWLKTGNSTTGLLTFLGYFSTGSAVFLGSFLYLVLATN
jgi:hypothetical protein